HYAKRSALHGRSPRWQFTVPRRSLFAALQHLRSRGRSKSTAPLFFPRTVAWRTQNEANVRSEPGAYEELCRARNEGCVSSAPALTGTIEDISDPWPRNRRLVSCSRPESPCDGCDAFCGGTGKSTRSAN